MPISFTNQMCTTERPVVIVGWVRLTKSTHTKFLEHNEMRSHFASTAENVRLSCYLVRASGEVIKKPLETKIRKYQCQV